MFYQSIRQMHKMLGRLDAWLVKTSEFAQKKSFDANTVLAFRLAADQYPFVRQVQLSCDHAKFAPARLTGREAPKHPDDEQTIDSLRTRVGSVRSWLESFAATDFEGAEKRIVTYPRWEGKVMLGEDYLVEHAMPQFYFHVTHAYAILRHNGVDIGKKDYLGPLSLRAP
ncbi:MAG TPA: DUF1993 domain-containing protein [Polyangiaceae bacterium]|nr:DUF1993 domain-containing protein [Polyangiaceae bacterium]